MSSLLSIDEIKSQFPDEWVLIGDPQTTPAPALLGGSVLWHSVDRDEVYQKAIELRPAKGPTNVAFFYTGKVPQEGVEFAL